MAGDDLGTLRVGIDANLSTFSAGLSKAKGDLQSWTTNTMNVIEKNEAALRGLGMAFSGIGIGLAGMGVLAIKEFSSFEKAMKNVQSISQGTQKDFQILSEYAMKLGKDTAFSSKEAAQALYYLASAGYSTTEQMEAANSVLLVATATQFDLARASELVATTITSFGLKAQDAGRVVDVMAKSTAIGQLTMEKLSFALPMAASKATELGWSLEETTSWLGLLADSGLRGEMAGTRLRDMLNDLLVPSEKAKIGLERIHIPLEKLPALLRDPHALLTAFTEAAKTGLLDAATSALIFGDSSEGMMKAVQQGTGAFDKYITGLTNAKGAAQAMADIQQQALAQSFEQLKGSVENLAIKFGAELAPSARLVAGVLEDIADKLAGLSEPTKAAIISLGGVGTALTLVAGPSLILVSQLPNLIKGFEALNVLAKGTLLTSLGAIGAALGIAAGAVAMFTYAIRDFNQEDNLLGLKISAQSDRLESLGTMLSMVKANGLDPATLSLQKLGERFNFTTQDIDLLNKMFGTNLLSTDSLTKAMATLTKAHTDSEKKLKDMTTATDPATVATKALADAQKLAQDGANAVAKTLAGKLNPVLVDTGEETDKAGEKVEKLKAKLIASRAEGLDVVADGLTKVNQETHKWVTTTDEAGIMTDTWALKTIKLGKEHLLTTDIISRKWSDTLGAFSASVKGVGQLANVGYKDLTQAALSHLEALKSEILVYNQEWSDLTISMGSQNNALWESMEANQLKIAKNEQEVRDSAAKWAEDYVWTAGGWIPKADLDPSTLQGYIDAGKAQAKKMRKEELEEILAFQAKELDSYDAKRKLIELDFKDLKKLYIKHGIDVTEAEKWRTQRLTELRIEEMTNYATIIGNGFTSVANSYVGLYNLIYNTDKGDEELKKTSLMRLLNWVNSSTTLIKSLADSYISLGKIMDAIGGGTSIINALKSIAPIAMPFAAAAVGVGAVLNYMDFQDYQKNRVAGSTTRVEDLQAQVKSGNMSGDQATLLMLQEQYNAGYPYIKFNGKTYSRAEIPGLLKEYQAKASITTTMGGLKQVESAAVVPTGIGTTPTGAGTITPEAIAGSYTDLLGSLGQGVANMPTVSVSNDNSYLLNNIYTKLTEILATLAGAPFSQIELNTSDTAKRVAEIDIVNVQAGNIIANQASMDDLASQIARSMQKQGLI